MACSQRMGFCRNDAGDMNMEVAPQYSGCSVVPIKPMSWNIGSQLTDTS